VGGLDVLRRGGEKVAWFHKGGGDGLMEGEVVAWFH